MDTFDEVSSLGGQVFLLGVVVLSDELVSHFKGKNGVREEDDGVEDKSDPFHKDQIHQKKDGKSAGRQIHGPQFDVLGSVKADSAEDQSGKSGGEGGAHALPEEVAKDSGGQDTDQNHGSVEPIEEHGGDAHVANPETQEGCRSGILKGSGTDGISLEVGCSFNVLLRACHGRIIQLMIEEVEYYLAPLTCLVFSCPRGLCMARSELE